MNVKGNNVAGKRGWGISGYGWVGGGWGMGGGEENGTDWIALQSFGHRFKLLNILLLCHNFMNGNISQSYSARLQD